MKRALTVFYLLAIAASIFFASWCVLHNTIHFQGDLARDFLLFEEIAVTKKPVLIGPRTSMQGVFHGPAWLYLNLPVFMASGGNPVVQGWFWVGLVAASIYGVYFVTKKLANAQVALPAAALYALTICGSAPFLYNPFGAVLLAPYILYFFILYMQKQKLSHLLISLLLIGFSIQFEMVWGVPVLFLSSLFFLAKIIRRKKFVHIIAYGILALPLSTFILFDLRHGYIQLKSFMKYVFGEPGKAREHVDFFALLATRIKSMFLVMPSYFSSNNVTLTIVFSVLCVILLYIFYKTGVKKKHPLVGYFLYFYIGFWVVSLPLKGIVYDYYYWAYLPLFCMCIAAIIHILFKKHEHTVFVIIILFLIGVNIQAIAKQDSRFFSTNTGLWNFYYGQAKSIYQDAQGHEFGWYVYTADQYAYSFKYAMSYTQTQYPRTVAAKFQKKPLTYLMIYPSDNKYTNEEGWRVGQVKISKKPEKVIKSIGGSYAEKYMLTPEEMIVQSDSSLLQDLTFR
jgi:hypothetical protein